MTLQSSKHRATQNLPIFKVVPDQGKHPSVAMDRTVCVVGRRYGVDPRIDERPVAGMRQVRLLEGDAAPTQELADRREEIPSRLDESDASDRARPRCVAKIREERRAPVRLDEQGCVRALEPGQVTDVRLPAEDVRRSRDEQGLAQAIRQALDPAQPRSFARNSSASR